VALPLTLAHFSSLQTLAHYQSINTKYYKKGVITRGWQILFLNHEELSDLFKVRFEVREGTDRKINFQKRNTKVTMRKQKEKDLNKWYITRYSKDKERIFLFYAAVAMSILYGLCRLF